MINLKRVKFKLNETDEWQIGYVIGEYDGDNKVLLNEKLEYIPKMTEGTKTWTAYDIQDDLETRLNITIPN